MLEKLQDLFKVNQPISKTTEISAQVFQLVFVLHYNELRGQSGEFNEN